MTVGIRRAARPDNLRKKFHSCAAITVGYSRETRIVHNRLSNLSYTGISLNWGWGLLSYAASNVIAYNEISGAMCGELVDGGSVYNLGPQPGTRVHHNYLHRQCNLYGVLCECRGMTLSVGLPRRSILLAEAFVLQQPLPALYGQVAT